MEAMFRAEHKIISWRCSFRDYTHPTPTPTPKKIAEAMEIYKLIQ